MQSIMILEDDKDLASGIKLALADDSMEFTLFDTIRKARAAVENHNFDLLIIDINLPDGSGLEFCKEIRKSSKVAILMLTAKDTELDIVTGLESGADDYITKPFNLMILRARIRALLRRAVNDTSGTYEKAPFVFKFDTMEFYKRQSLIELSRTEQKILYLLVFNGGQVITRERLLEWVWPDGTQYVEDNALSVAIRRLRDKSGECLRWKEQDMPLSRCLARLLPVYRSATLFLII